jgi:hypothetical protein
MQQGIQAGEWRRFGHGGPPEPWEHGSQRNLDRLSTSYFLDVMESRRAILALPNTDRELRLQIEELFTTATRHKHEIDYTLRHWATPVERARVEDRLGSLMRISRRLRSLLDHGPAGPRERPHSLPAA